MMKKRDNSYQATLRNNENDVKEMNNFCLALNYYNCRYSWTKSERLKRKYIQGMMYNYYLCTYWLEKHPDYALLPEQESTINSSKNYIRCHFRRCD